jgi:hypothetical protein
MAFAEAELGRRPSHECPQRHKTVLPGGCRLGRRLRARRTRDARSLVAPAGRVAPARRIWHRRPSEGACESWSARYRGGRVGGTRVRVLMILDPNELCAGTRLTTTEQSQSRAQLTGSRDRIRIALNRAMNAKTAEVFSLKLPVLAPRRTVGQQVGRHHRPFVTNVKSGLSSTHGFLILSDSKASACRCRA